MNQQRLLGTAAMLKVAMLGGEETERRAKEAADETPEKEKTPDSDT